MRNDTRCRKVATTATSLTDLGDAAAIAHEINIAERTTALSTSGKATCVPLSLARGASGDV